MRHWTRSLHFFNLQRNCVSFVNAHPDGKYGLPLHILQYHDGHVGHGIHHQAADFHLHFHMTSRVAQTSVCAAKMSSLPSATSAKLRPKEPAPPPSNSASLPSPEPARTFPEARALGKR